MSGSTTQDTPLDEMTPDELNTFLDTACGRVRGCWFHPTPRLHDCGSCRDAVTE